MHSLWSLIVGFLAISTSNAIVIENRTVKPQPTCHQNACLNVVVQDSAPGGRGGCKAFFEATVIPATSTTLTTTTRPPTSTATRTSTVVSTSVVTGFASTTTSVSTEDDSATATTLTTTTLYVTGTSTLPYTTRDDIQKRAISAKATTTSATTVPAYASAACHNTVQYSSACSCINAKHSTTTLATPVVTSTVTRYSKSQVTIFTSTTATSTSADADTLTVLTTTTTVSTSISTDIDSETSTTTTTTITASASPTCGNAGVQFAYYPYTGSSQTPDYDGYEPADYKTQTPTLNNTINEIGGFPPAIPGQMYPTDGINPGEDFVLNHRGYIYAANAGDYTITASNVDDLVDVWVGAKAYSGYTRANNDLEVQYYDGSGSSTVTLTQGYNPIRIYFLQAKGGLSFSISVTDPDGNTIATTGQSSPNVIQFGCLDSDDAPMYPDFGSET